MGRLELHPQSDQRRLHETNLGAHRPSLRQPPKIHVLNLHPARHPPQHPKRNQRQRRQRPRRGTLPPNL